jgi:hypothetical protein
VYQYKDFTACTFILETVHFLSEHSTNIYALTQDGKYGINVTVKMSDVFLQGHMNLCYSA